MNLRKKKQLISRVLKVGVGRIKLNSEMLEEIKEAITRQDILDLKKGGGITIKENAGRRKKKKRKTKKKHGSIKKRIGKRKRNYVRTVRKLRSYAKNLRARSQIGKEEYENINKKIKSGIIKDVFHLREAVK